jgi:hypothetical protein
MGELLSHQRTPSPTRDVVRASSSEDAPGSAGTVTFATRFFQ